MNQIDFKRYGIESTVQLSGDCEERYYEGMDLPLLIIIPEMHGHLRTIYGNAKNARSILNSGAVDLVALEGVQWPNGLTLDEFVTFSLDNEYMEKYLINRLFELILFKDLYGLQFNTGSQQAEWSLHKKYAYPVIFQSVDNEDLHSKADEWGNKNNEDLYNGLVHDIEEKVRRNEEEESVVSFIIDEINGFHRKFMKETAYGRDIKIVSNIQQIRQKKGLSKAVMLNIGSDHADYIVCLCQEKRLFNVVLATHEKYDQCVKDYDHTLASIVYEMVSNKKKHWDLRIRHLKHKRPNPYFYLSKVLADYQLQIKDCTEFCENINDPIIDRADENHRIILDSILKIRIIAYALRGMRMTKIACMDDVRAFFTELSAFIYDSDRMGICREIPPMHRALYELSNLT